MASPCAATLSTGGVCGAKKGHSVHVLALGRPGSHPYLDSRRAGLQPMSEGMRAFREASGYNEAAEASKGQACQIVSPVCTGRAEHLHEPLPRGRAGGLKAALRDGPAPIPACDACNGWIMENQVWARERGFIVKPPARGRERP